MKKISYFFLFYFVFSAGCAGQRLYYYNANKTPADQEKDYTQCMRSIDAHTESFQPEITKYLEECMRSKGYQVISEKEAKQLGIAIPKVWPPYARRSSSVGPW